jgi:acyl-CoA thioesterase
VTQLAQTTDVLSLSPTWFSWTGVHGGYLTALMAGAARTSGVGMPLRSMQVVFLRSLRGRSCRVSSSLVKRGRSTTVVRAEAHSGSGSDDGPAVSALLTFGEDDDGPEYRGEPMPDVRGPQDCDRYQFPVDFVPFTQHLEIRPAAGSLPFSGGSTAEFVAWVRLLLPLDPTQTLLVLADALPPALYAVMTEAAAVPSADLGVHMTGAAASLDPAAWRLVRIRTEAASGGWSIDDSDVWSDGGTLLASARQSRRVLR